MKEEIRAIVDGSIRFDPSLHPKFHSRLVRAFSFGNPEYFRLQAMGRDLSFSNVRERIEAAVEDHEGNLSIPRGGVDLVRSTVEEKGGRIDWIDRRQRGEVIEIPRRHTDGPNALNPRPYQVEALKEIERKTQGLIVIGCGGGKTTIGVLAIERFARTAIVLVHTGDLLDQWGSALRDRLGIEAGVIADGKLRPSSVTVAMIQTLAKRLDDPEVLRVLDASGVVVLDECFAAGTLVDGRRIETLKPGDEVLAFDEPTGTMVTSKIVRVFRKKARQLVRVSFASGRSTVCTPDHLFMTRGGWAKAIWLGDRSVLLSTPNDHPFPALCFDKVISVGLINEESDVFDLEVEGQHTYTANGYVVHNCHHAPAQSFRAVLDRCPARVRVGLTATPKREDGLTRIVDWTFGERLIERPSKWLLREGYLMRPALEVVTTDFRFASSTEDKFRRSAEMAAALEQHEPRLHAIASIAAANVKDGQRVLVLANRKDYARALGRLIWEYGGQAFAITGDTAKKARKDLILKFRLGECPCLVATSLANEGLDAPKLSRIIFAWPERSEGATDQKTGRLMRIAQKVPVLIDVVDQHVPELVKRYESRARVYRALGMDPPKAGELTCER